MRTLIYISFVIRWHSIYTIIAFASNRINYLDTVVAYSPRVDRVYAFDDTHA